MMSDTLNKSERLVEGITVVKKNLTTALQNKGVTVSEEAKLKDYPSLVESIEVGEKVDLTNLTAENVKAGVTINGIAGTFTNDSNATADTILTGYRAYVKGFMIDGQMPFSSIEKTGVLTATVSKGYISQAETITFSDDNLVASNILQGKTIFGVTGTFTSDANAVGSALKEGYTAYVNGQKIYGELPNVGLFQDGYLTVKIFSGWTFGGSLTLTDSNLLPANILQGKTIFGVSGSIDLSNLLPENIKSGVTINGIIGTYEGSGSTTDKQVLVLSGFSSSETAIYGVDLNGEYVLVSTNVPSYDRIWVCEANGVQLMYKSAWGYWGLINNTASGGNTYTYGEGENPYKADGSSAQWQTQGANISATAVVKGSNNGGGTGGGDEPESSLTKVEVYASYLESPVEGISFNGTYTIQDQTKSGKEAVYVNEANGAELYWQGGVGCWCMRPLGGSYAYIYMDNHTGNDPWEVVGTGTSWRDDMKIPGGSFPAGTVTLVTDEGGDDSGTSNADYTVSGAGTEAANGDYVAYESSYTAYKHTTNDIYLWYDSNLVKWYICMTGPGTTGVAEVYYETAVDCPDPTTASWFTSTPAGSDPAPTVTKGGGSSSGGGSEGDEPSEPDTPDVETSYLLVQGFSPSNFGGTGTTLDPNGKYYLEDETATGNERVWVSESGYFKIYDASKQGSWYLDGVYTYLGEAVYPENNDNTESPYKTDGSSCDWLSMGAMISGASVTLVGGSSDDSGSGEGGESGGTSNADYIVSGSSTAEVNGDYTNTGRISNDRPVYTNGTYYMRWYSGMWEITEEDENSNMKPPKHSVSSSDMTPPASGWYGGITVTSGGNESSTPADYTVTGAGTAAVNGYYYNTGETKGNYPVYANSNGVKLWFFNMMGGWVFSPDFSESTASWYYHCEAYGDVTTGNWADDALYPTVDALGAAPLPTVTKA